VRSSHRRSKSHSASAHTLGEHVVISDDYDSFETDSDDHGDGEPDQRLRNVSAHVEPIDSPKVTLPFANPAQ